MIIYKDKDFTYEFNKIVEQAKSLWKEICKDNFEKYGDEGSCVLGAGIEIKYLPKKCRKYRHKFIIEENEVSKCQGSLNWERRIEEVLEFLKKNNIEAHYNSGYLD